MNKQELADEVRGHIEYFTGLYGTAAKGNPDAERTVRDRIDGMKTLYKEIFGVPYEKVETDLGGNSE